MKDHEGPSNRRERNEVDITENRRPTKPSAARIKLSARVSAGPRRKTGSSAERAAHLKKRLD
jgi:hypothetical protein